eukprot:5518491-Amphidinium_carterae.1
MIAPVCSFSQAAAASTPSNGSTLQQSSSYACTHAALLNRHLELSDQMSVAETHAQGDPARRIFRVYGSTKGVAANELWCGLRS